MAASVVRKQTQRSHASGIIWTSPHGLLGLLVWLLAGFAGRPAHAGLLDRLGLRWFSGSSARNRLQVQRGRGGFLGGSYRRPPRQMRRDPLSEATLHADLEDEDIIDLLRTHDEL
eukprot:TRINITY_DN22928_c0_g1_i1.p2 TRINITY_DN22928_c0_g1~~TRINITY_DN22928_c0_g1_i1.p2  ORF type:complete len:115 (+),score=17.39 TRINITY_DN22928_c0_g1_i1:70-414(+)